MYLYHTHLGTGTALTNGPARWVVTTEAEPIRAQGVVTGSRDAFTSRPLRDISQNLMLPHVIYVLRIQLCLSGAANAGKNFGEV